MEFINTFDKHANEPNKAVDAYIKEKKLELGKWVNQRKKVYLDTKFWLLLRDAHMGRAKQQCQYDLLKLVTGGVLSGKLICPISEDIFQEVIKQTDEVTLRATVELIDSLSAGVTLLSHDERWETEVLHFVRSCNQPKEKLYFLHDLVWTKLAYTHGMQIPHNGLLSDAENLLIQKSFIDQMWSLSLLDMFNLVGFDRLLTFPHIPDLSCLLNEEKDNYNAENADFKSIFLTELGFVLRNDEARFESMFTYLYEKEHGYAPQPEEVQATNPGRLFANSVYNVFRQQKAGNNLPTIEIEAGIHAQLIYDRTRRYKANDIYDINHAIAAIPYCDYFFTEKNLREFIIRKNLAFDSKFNCIVVASVIDAVSEIQLIVD